ncbi:MAG: chromosome segregation ATPase [Conexibacter sp.]|nr:chromosome segregation ATPase [Conexibacter sp.]MCW2996926.1 chromosome segregation ATPase [Solirubrobacterales bacterium]
MSDAAWLPDPDGRHQHRYWDGVRWTNHVANNGVQSVDDDIPVAPRVVAAMTPTPTGVSSGIPRFGARKAAQRLSGELEAAQEALVAVDGLSLLEVQQLIETRRQELAALEAEQRKASQDLAEARREIVETRDIAVLQEAGIYEYSHPLEDALAFQGRLKELQSSIKTAARPNGGAVTGATDWTVNGSAAQGRKMIAETSKLMLRAYNAEADNLVRGLKPYKRDAAIERLNKVRDTIARLGKTMSVEISPAYHQLRVEEIRLTADYVAMREEEKEREREEKARLREERLAQQEMERERKRLEKEQSHYLNALEALEASGDLEAAARMRAQLEEIGKAIDDVDYRAANIRAGYVYVISNIGSFGGEVVKIGMTRRLEPQDRVRELGDASVPFRYDTHAMFFAQDAVTIENQLHKHFADRRINRVNPRREFFRATPQEVRLKLADLAGDLLEFTETAEAVEYRQSLTEAADA